MNKSKYPVYIISKGRYKNPLTARMFKEDGIYFKMAVEPQEYKDYCKAIGKEFVKKLPFKNLGLGSYPARNWCWENSIQNGYKKHWIFDDNIYRFYRINRGYRIPCNGLKALTIHEDFIERYKNIGLSGFSYRKFTTPTCPKPFYYNTHVYSAILINNSVNIRWRLKYNEDVDLCLQILNRGLCTISLNAFLIKKVSTSTMMSGGNQEELYKNNRIDKKILKVKSLEEMWPQYVKTVWKFNRPHHSISWKKYFKQPLLIKDKYKNIKPKVNNYGLKLVEI